MKKTIAILSGALFLTANAFAEDIHPITREMGSGTRSAFVELFQVQKKIKNKKVDAITQKAEITNSTGVMITSIQNDKNAIGYISLGALNHTVKSVAIDGVSANIKNIQNGTYKIQRPFYVVTKKDNPLISDFLNIAMQSADIIQKAGYIPNNNQKTEYKTKKPSGKLVIAGSSSVSPLMEKLVEYYRLKNPNADIEIQTSDSTMGANLVVDNIADIGMLSRDLKQSEKAKGLNPKILATDGLAIIVHNENPVNNLSAENIRAIFLGNLKQWNQIK